jgi:hypothetical protein
VLVGGDLAYEGWVRLGLAVAGEKTVYLLLDVGKLGVAEALDRFVSQQGCYEGFVVVEELFGIGDGTVAPSSLVTGESDAAELGDEYGLAPVAMAGSADGEDGLSSI